MVKMQNNSLSSKLSTIQPLLVRYFEEKERIEQGIIREGRVPKAICSLCEGYSTKRWIEPFSKDEERDVSQFVQSMKENKISSINRLINLERIVYPSSRISIYTSQEFGRKKPEPTNKGLNRYTYRISEFKKRTFCPKEFKKILERFDRIVSCAHFDVDYGESVHLVIKWKGSEQFKVEYDEGRLRYDVLFLCCTECKAEIEKRGCVAGVRKDGFIYTKRCDLDFLLLQKILKEAGLSFELGHRYGSLIERSSPDFYLREHGILVILNEPFSITERLEQQYEAMISALKPKLIVFFGDKTKIIDLLGYDTNVLVASEEGFYAYDHTRPVEESVGVIVNNIVEKLDNYAEETRGNEHDRLVKAFEKLGQELGYVPQQEYSKHGLRVDCVWYDKQGKIRVAIEVETRGGWKKDIVSTWELEPQLSIITTYQKTDSVPRALMDFALMRSIPHKLFYINMETKNAYLFNKQEILRRYSLKKEGEEERFALKNV